MMMGPTKKKVITAGVVAFTIPVVVGSFMFMQYKKGVEEEMNRLRIETATVERYVFANSLTAGEIITKGDLKLAKIKEESAPKDSYTDKKNINSKNVGEVLDVDTLIGRRVRINAEEKTIVASSMLVTDEDKELTIDERFQEFNSILLPSDLNSGDYIDIRLTMPSGENYIVVSGKEVKDIGKSTDSNTMYLQLSEEEILRTTAAILESYMGDGFKIYATKYVDPSAQLYTYKRVNLIEAYKEAIKALVEERQKEADEDPTAYKEKYHIETSNDTAIGAITGALGGGKEKIKVTEADITIAEIATKMGLEQKQVKEIKKAVDENDEELQKLYNDKLVATRRDMVNTYPVKANIANLIKANPNILETIKEKYNLEQIIKERSELFEMPLYRYNEYGNLEVQEALTKIQEGINREIEVQKAERKKYLQALVLANSNSSEE